MTDPKPTPTPRFELDIPFRTFLKLFVALALAYALIQLVPLLLLMLISALLATTLHPICRWLEKRGLPRWAALAIVCGSLIGFVAASALILVPRIVEQIGHIGATVTQFQQELMTRLPGGWVKNLVARSIKDPQTVVTNLPQQALVIGSVALGGLSSLLLFLIISIYLVIDGGTAYEWVAAFFAPKTQAKLNQTADEISEIVFAYIMGQLITSALVAVYSFTILTILKVPGALTLAAIAALFDMLPIVGFISSLVCAALLAATVSSSTAFLVVAFYVGYSMLENYVIVPKVYGKRMRLSTLVVLLSFVVAGTLAGIAGAILVLPIVASYPIIERIWLKKHLGEATVQEHQVETASDSNSRSGGPGVKKPD